VQPLLSLRAPMKSADSLLIQGTSSKLRSEYRFRDGIKKTPLGAVNLFGKLLTLVI